MKGGGCTQLKLLKYYYRQYPNLHSLCGSEGQKEGRCTVSHQAPTMGELANSTAANQNIGSLTTRLDAYGVVGWGFDWFSERDTRGDGCPGMKGSAAGSRQTQGSPIC